MNNEVIVKDDSIRDLRERTKVFALEIVKLYSSLPQTDITRVLGKQLLRSGTSVGAHYREACRARSAAEFISKLESGLQELDETSYWLELLIESESIISSKVNHLQKEMDELMSIFVASVKTKKRNKGE